METNVPIIHEPSCEVAARGISREPSRDRSERSVSISHLKVDDPLRKELIFQREKSPFELVEKPRSFQLASSKAIIDKALVMDVSGGVTNVDEYINLFFSDMCIIDEALVKDVSSGVQVVVIEEEEEEPEVVIEPMVEVPPEPVQEAESDSQDKKKLRWKSKEMCYKMKRKNQWKT